MTSADRLGVAPYGDADAPIGNVLLQPRRAVLSLFRRTFGRADMFSDVTRADPREQNPFLYEVDANGDPTPTSRLIIADSGAEALAMAEARPRIAVDRGTGRFAGNPFSQRMTQSPGVTRYAALFETSLVVRCVARTRLESELLALTANMVLWFARDVLMRKVRLHSLSAPEISQTIIERRDSSAEQWSTTLTSDLTQAVSWENRPATATRLHEVCLSFETVADFNED